MQPSLKIVIVDKNPIRAAILEDGLREAGHVHVVRLAETSHLLARIYALDPDVRGLQKERIKNILDLCISRFNSFARLRDELERARTALEERKVIDRAKGILMTAKNLTEEAAYALLRRTAMNESKKIAEVAQSVVTAAELLK